MKFLLYFWTDFNSPREEETLNFQILYEADWLINIEEEGISKDRKKAEELIGKVFRNITGRELAEKLYRA